MWTLWWQFMCLSVAQPIAIRPPPQIWCLQSASFMSGTRNYRNPIDSKCANKSSDRICLPSKKAETLRQSKPTLRHTQKITGICLPTSAVHRCKTAKQYYQCQSSHWKKHSPRPVVDLWKRCVQLQLLVKPWWWWSPFRNWSLPFWGRHPP